MRHGANTTNHRLNETLLREEARLNLLVAEPQPMPLAAEPQPMLLVAQALHASMPLNQSVGVDRPSTQEDFALKLPGGMLQRRDAVSTRSLCVGPTPIVVTSDRIATTTATSVPCTGTTVCSSTDHTPTTTITTWSTTRPSPPKVKPALLLWKWHQHLCLSARWTVTTLSPWDCVAEATCQATKLVETSQTSEWV
jgi:hypothetical protein